MSAALKTRSELSGDAIAARIEALAALSDDPNCLTRLTLSPAHRKAAALVGEWMRAAGMSLRLDAAGNVIGRYDAAKTDAKCIVIGSHIDTVRNAGKYDGNLGVVTGIAVVDELNRLSMRLPFAIEVVAFADEEGVRFSSTLTGSRALAGAFQAASLDDIDADGVSRREALAAFGADPSRMAQAALDPARVSAYLEVHIEQGPVLEARTLPVGIVTAINGATRGEVSVSGTAGHSGTLPMAMRRDALVAAAEMIVAIEARAKRDDLVVATVGRIVVPNGAVNIVPGQTRFSLDVRSSSDDARRMAVADIEADIARIARARGVAATFAASYDMPAAACDAGVMQAMSAAFERNGHEPFRLASGAGHDAMSFRDRIPIGMIFVRCRGGISHNPAEFATPPDMGAAARILFDLLTEPGAFE